MRENRSLLLRPTGSLRADTCADLRQRLALAFSDGVTAIAVDLSRVADVDPTGLGVLAGAAKHLRTRDGVLVVLRPQPSVERALRVNGMGDLLLLPAFEPLRASAAVEKVVVDLVVDLNVPALAS